ncbi:MAG: twin-arginine translocase TatA/TatE family subunit [Flavobacteriales bacterium]|nr:twin-arginine translocase TatA/TatE family subunit [Flavobacteriales bacterium]
MGQLLFLNIGGGELFFIILVVIIFFGPKSIPELARGLGKGLRELKNATDGIQQEIKESVGEVPNINKSINLEQKVNQMIFEETSKQEATPEKTDSNSQPKTVSRNNSVYTSGEISEENKIENN